MNKLKTILGIVLLGAALNLTAQQSINASGGEATGAGHASYSIGQLTYITLSSVSDDASIFQGVQIPYEIYGPDCSVFNTPPVDLTKSFDPVNGVQDRVQLKWHKAGPQVRYSDEDAAACDVKFWPKRNLIPGTTTPTGPVIVASASDTVNFVDTKKFYGDGVTPREIFKWPVKFRKASDAPSAKRADPNIRYEWKVRCACEHGAGQESPWSAVKIFNVLDFDPVTGIYTPPPGQEDLSLTKNLVDEEMEIQLYPNPNDGTFRIRFESDEKITEVQLTLRDIQGKLIEQQVHRIVKGGQEIVWSSFFDLESGLYLLDIRTDTYAFSKRVIIDK